MSEVAGNALSAERKALRAISRRFTQIRIRRFHRRNAEVRIFAQSGDNDWAKNLAFSPDPTLIGGRNHLPLALDQRERAVRAVNEELTVSEI